MLGWERCKSQRAPVNNFDDVVTLKNSMLVCLWIAPRAPQTLVQGQGGSHCVCVTASCVLFCREGGLWAHAGPHIHALMRWRSILTSERMQLVYYFNRL